ncbi:MAG: 6-bladed beta-propeller [Gemmatimonadota bacterium]
MGSYWAAVPLILILAPSCDRAPDEGDGARGPAVEPASDAAEAARGTIRDSAGITVIEYPGDVLDRVHGAELAGTPEVVIGRDDERPGHALSRVADGFRTPDGRIFLLERLPPEVRVFEEGRLVNTIGRSGEGPGEFNDPRTLVRLEEERFVVTDRRLGRLSTFGLDGELASTVRLFNAPNVVAPLRNGELLAVGDSSDHMASLDEGRNVRRVRLFLLRLDRDGVADTLARIDGLEGEVWWDGTGMSRFGAPWYLLKNWSAVSARGVWFSDGADWEIVRYSPVDGQIDRIVRIDRPLESFTDARIDEFVRSGLEALADGRHADVEWNHEDAAYPQSVPPIRDLFQDATGKLWIGLLEPPVASLPYNPPEPLIRRWLLLEAEGSEAEGVLSLPPDRRPLYADQEGVLTVAPDSFDAPIVEWWPFRE